MQIGVKPRKYRDHRRYSFARTFGVSTLTEEVDLDVGLTNPNQNIQDPVFGNPPYPNGCTGFTTSDIATDADRIIYDPGFVYRNTLLIANSSMGSACTLQDSMKAATVYGLRAKGENEGQALQHRRGPYFEVERASGMDYFDSFWSALLTGGKSVSVGTPWFPEITSAVNGFVDDVVIRDTPFWHDWKACGVKMFYGKPYLKVKAWVGPSLGDKGFYWFSRETVNKLMAVKGTDALTNAKAVPGDIKVVQLTILQTIVSYYYRLLKLVK